MHAGDNAPTPPVESPAVACTLDATVSPIVSRSSRVCSPLRWSRTSASRATAAAAVRHAGGITLTDDGFPVLEPGQVRDSADSNLREPVGSGCGRLRRWCLRHGGREGRVIALRLVGVGHGKTRHSLIHGIAATEVGR
jgi:hypothetical protein